MKCEEICCLLVDKVNKLKNKENSLLELLFDVCLLYGEMFFVCILVMYESGIIIFFFGYKIGYINECVFCYDVNEYLLLMVLLLFECEIYVMLEVLLVGLCFNVDILQLQELLMDIGEDEYFQLLMVVSGINFVMLLEEILCVVEWLFDVME